MLKHKWLGAVVLGAAALTFSSTKVTADHKIVICHNDVKNNMSVVMLVPPRSVDRHFATHGDRFADDAYLGKRYGGLGCGA